MCYKTVCISQTSRNQKQSSAEQSSLRIKIRSLFTGTAEWPAVGAGFVPNTVGNNLPVQPKIGYFNRSLRSRAAKKKCMDHRITIFLLTCQEFWHQSTILLHHSILQPHTEHIHERQLRPQRTILLFEYKITEKQNKVELLWPLTILSLTITAVW